MKIFSALKSWFANLKVKSKINLGYFVVLTLLIGVGSLGIYRTQQMGTTVTLFANDWLNTQHLADTIVSKLLLTRLYANKYVRSSLLSDLEFFNREFADFQKLLSEVTQESQNNQYAQSLEEIKNGVQQYGQGFLKIAALITKRDEVITKVLEVQGALAEETLERLRSETFQTNHYDVSYYTGNAQNSLLLMRIATSKYLQEGDEKWMNSFKNDYEKMQKHLETLNTKITEEDLRKPYRQIVDALEQYYQAFMSLQADYALQRQIINNDLDGVGAEIQRLATEMSANVIKTVDEQYQLTQTLVSNTFLSLTSAIIFAVVFSTILGITISANIMEQLGGEPATVAAVARRIAQGEFATAAFHTDKPLTGLFKSIQEMQTQLQERIEKDKRITEEALRINQALDNVITAVLIIDDQHRIIYLNNAARDLFKLRESAIRNESVDFNAYALLGKEISVLYKDSQQRKQLFTQSLHTHYVTLNISNLTIDSTITPVMSAENQRLGTVIEFRDRTVEVMVEQEVNSVIQAASQGNFEKRINLAEKSGFFKVVSEAINRILAFNQDMIRDVMQVFSGLAKGNLNQKIESDYVGAFEQLKIDVNTTTGKLTEIIGAIQQTADIVTTAATEISQGNLNLSQRTEQQSASLEEIATSMEQMTSTVQQNADNAEQANQLASGAKERAIRGGEVVQATTVAINEISKSSKKITDIISVINEIAFQTNLLALNAAVEAARAGEQGRGFAVVATEVRNLAQRSAVAAKEIKNLIQDSVAKVKEGTQLADRSGKTLEEIVIAVKRVSDIVAEIAAASREQSMGINQVNKAILQMDEVTQQNAALVEQAAAASESMTEQVRYLKQQVAFFNQG